MDTHAIRRSAKILGVSTLAVLLAQAAFAAAPTPSQCAAPASTQAAPTAAAGTVAGAGSPAGETAQKNEPVRVYTNADLERLGPVPGQKAPIAEPWVPPPDAAGPVGWDNIFAWIERERSREQQRQDREMAREAAARAEKEREEYAASMSGIYTYPGYGYGWGYPSGGCGNSTGCGGWRGLPQETNVFLPLELRGIRTAAGLYRESVRNSAIRRASVR